MESHAVDRRLPVAFVRRPARWAVSGLALAAVVLGASACGSATSPTTTASTGVGASTTSSSAPGSSSSSSSTTAASGSSALSKIESQIQAGQAADFVATYSITASAQAGKTLTMTLAHSGSNSLFGIVTASGQFKEILAGTATDICAQEATSWQCYSGSGGLASAFTTMIKEFENLYGSQALSLYLKDDAHIAVGTSTSSKTVAGQQVSCVSYHLTTNSDHWTYCVTSQGVIAEAAGSASTGTFTMTMTSYSTTVPSNEFTPPATPTTLP